MNIAYMIAEKSPGKIITKIKVFETYSGNLAIIPVPKTSKWYIIITPAMINNPTLFSLNETFFSAWISYYLLNQPRQTHHVI
jgi:hypothetical protein